MCFSRLWLVVAVLLCWMLPSGPGIGGTLDVVREHGYVRCGINPALAGFGRPDATGLYQGLNADLCRAVAAAVFDDPGKVRFTPLTAKDRFTSLLTGDIDLLTHNTSWTLSRDAQFDIPAILFFDGQGFMAHRKLGVSGVKDLNGASICAQQGSTAELNLADYFRANGLRYEILSFGSNDDALNAYVGGRCDALTTDVTSLYAERVKLADPDADVILPEIISKEPLGPAVRHGDSQWADIVRWTVFALLDAEELGISQASLGDAERSTNPEIRRFLGLGDKLGEQIGLSADWAARIVRHVGNYGEIFDRNLGQSSPMKIARGQNRLWTKGGLHYAPPIR